ncbi:hypothetical protein [uncultured Roseibium sp.]|uniref:hypothetical protein n=1 Tax=uncultured Roseibium sp. TaxID=1936171 RepID=UPI002638A42B|nr:hypothetical protein [uncultured Roseibium sp.]
MLPRGMTLLAVFFFSTQPSAAFHDYIDRNSNTVTTTHQAAYRVSIIESFEPLGELHHRQESNGRMFKVSFAAFSKGSDIVLIHAETLEEPTGILDYGHLDQVKMDGVAVSIREQCVPAEAEAALADNPEANFVKDNGFDLRLPFLLTQHLITSDDGNAEVVISYGRGVEDCDVISESIRKDIRLRVENSITLERLTD